jgi:hypothetical protein
MKSIFCKTCGKKIPRRINGKRKRAKIYCSVKCYAKSGERKHSDETKRRLRLAQISYLKSTCGIMPTFNKSACEFFEKFDLTHDTSGRYATNSGEFYIKELGYWVDYINFDLKLIIEWNENKHYKNGSLNDRDVKRQKEILQIFSEYDFVQLKHDDTKMKVSLLGNNDYTRFQKGV